MALRLVLVLLFVLVLEVTGKSEDEDENENKDEDEDEDEDEPFPPRLHRLPITPPACSNSLLKCPFASHSERSAAAGEGGAARSRGTPSNHEPLPKQAHIGFCSHLARTFHGIPRLR